MGACETTRAAGRSAVGRRAAGGDREVDAGPAASAAAAVGGPPAVGVRGLNEQRRTGAFARGRTDDEEGGEDVRRGSAHGGPGPFAARDPEERLLEGPLAFLHLPRIRPARRRGELGEEVEERALIGSRAGVDPRGRERAKALVQLR